jgi:putative DNA primase/helicase
MTTIAEAAAIYAKRGWKPVPVSRKTKKAIGTGWQKRPYDPAQFNGNAQNVGVQLGEVSNGLADVDLDTTTAIGLAPEFLPPTGAIFGHRSKPASHQLYVSELWKTEPRAVIQFREYVGGKPMATLVELRIGGNGKGAASVFPPSMHETGEMVEWVRNGEPANANGDALKLAVTKLAIATLLLPRYPGGGSRHDGALVLGGVLARAGWSAENIEHVVGGLARAAGDDDVRDRQTAAVSAIELKANGGNVPGWPRFKEMWGDDAATTLGKWLGAVRPPPVPAGLEDSVALEFSALHVADLHYVAAWNKWLEWDGTRWRFEDTLHAFDLARVLCRGAGDADNKTVAAVVALARTDRRQAATVAQWDADPWLLGTPGGTIDLRTGELMPARQSDYITKITSVAPADEPPAQSCQLWLEFLQRVTGGSQKLQDFLQRTCGYCLTGLTIEDALFFLYGLGANGKSVFLRTVAGVLGDYHKTASMEMFTVTMGERHPTDLAMLRGARLVTAIETEEGKRWDESKLKAMTGGDPIAARFMRQDFFEYVPQFKLMIAGNHKPVFRNVDEAIRRRVKLASFTVTIPLAERDKKLSEKLKAEWPGILRWMIEGCLAWQRDGLKPPDVVKNATDDYLSGQDDLQRFIEDACVVGVNESDSIEHLWDGWVDWAEDNREFLGNKRRFSDRLADKGYKRGKGTSGTRKFLGIRCVRENAKKAEAEARKQEREWRMRNE